MTLTTTAEPRPATVDSARPAAAPLGATPLAGGTNFAVASEVADGDAAVPVRRRRARRPRSRCVDFDAGVWHGFVPGVGPGPGATGSGCSASSTRRAACAATRPSCCSIPYARATTGEVTFGPEVRGDDVADPATAQRARLGRPRPAQPRRRPRLRLGRSPPRPSISYADSVIYEVHVKGFTMTHPGVPAGAARHVRRPRPPGGHRPPRRPRRHHGAAAPGPPARARVVPRRAGPDELLGLQHDRLLRPPRRLLGGGPRRRPAVRSPSSRRWSQALHAAGLEVLLDVVYNHTAEGDRRRPDAVPPRPRQPGATTGSTRPTRAATSTRPAAATR